MLIGSDKLINTHWVTYYLH